MGGQKRSRLVRSNSVRVSFQQGLAEGALKPLYAAAYGDRAEA
jgi:hypothetical protein